MRKIAILLLAAFVAISAGCSKSKSNAESSHQSGAESGSGSENQESASIDRLKEKIANQLKDPQSAQFRNLEYKSSSQSLCGEINAKNTFGGYVGFRRFTASDAEVQIEGERKADRGEDLVSRVSYKAAAIKSGCPTADE